MFKRQLRPVAVVGALAVAAAGAVISLAPVSPAHATVVGTATLSQPTGNANANLNLSTSGPCSTAGASRIRGVISGFGLPEGGYTIIPQTTVGFSSTEAMQFLWLTQSFEGVSLLNNSTPLVGKYDLKIQCVNSLGTNVYDEYATSMYWFTPNNSFANISKARFSTTPFYGVNKAPAYTGVAKVGSKVTASAGSYSPTPTTIAYQWLRGGAAISGANKSAYIVAAADAGKLLSVRVTVSGGATPALAQVTAAKKVAFGTLVSKSAPKVTGKAKVGKKLKTTKGTWSPAPTTYAYQWLRSGKAISKATKSTYKLTKKDKGKKISVRVTVKKAGYTTISKSSKVTAKVKK